MGRDYECSKLTLSDLPKQPLSSRDLAFKYPCLRAGSGGIVIQATTVSEAV